MTPSKFPNFLLAVSQRFKNWDIDMEKSKMSVAPHKNKISIRVK